MEAGRVYEFKDEGSIKAAIKSGIPMVLKIHASWCVPCRNMEPTDRRVAEKLKGKVLFSEVEYDRARKLSMAYGVQGVPTYLVFKDGVEKKRRPGMMSEAALTSLIKSGAGIE